MDQVFNLMPVGRFSYFARFHSFSYGPIVFNAPAQDDPFIL